MRAAPLLLLLTLVQIGCGGDSGTSAVTPPPVSTGGATRDTVSTLPETFVPNIVTLQVGGTVAFAFGGGISHNVIFNRAVAGAPADIQITKDVVVSRTFGTRGTFKYDCTVHPGMRGEVDVR